MKAASLSARLDRMPMVKAVAPFAAGILAADCFTLPLWFLAGAFLLSGTLALLLHSQSGALVMLLTAGFAASQLRDTAHTLPRGIYTTYELTVEGIPAERGRYTSAEATAVAWRDPSDGTWHASGDRIMLYADSLTALYPGERIRCRGSVRPFRGGAESYRRLMARRGFAGTLWLSERTLIERLPGRSSALHLHAVERMQRIGMRDDAGAVCRAMVTGDRSGITQELRTVYSRSGLSHLLAVSGLHTGIVFALVNLMLWWLPLLHRGHLVRNLLATVCIWLFVAAAGFSPSAVRAAVMCTMLQFALASASEYVALNALAAAGFGMLLWTTSVSSSRSSPSRPSSPGACRSADCSIPAGGRSTCSRTPSSSASWRASPRHPSYRTPSAQSRWRDCSSIPWRSSWEVSSYWAAPSG